MIKNLKKLAKSLDKLGFHAEANKLASASSFFPKKASKITEDLSQNADLLFWSVLKAMFQLGGYDILVWLDKADKDLFWNMYQKSRREGMIFSIKIDGSKDPAALNNASGFIPSHVKGSLLKDGKVVNSNSTAIFQDGGITDLESIANVRIPKNYHGDLLLPDSVFVYIVYNDGTRRLAKSSPENNKVSSDGKFIANISIFSKNITK